MKSGIVSPAYDASELIDWKFGPSITGTPAVPAVYAKYNDDDGNIGNLDKAHYLALQRWNAQPGRKVITKVNQACVYIEGTTYGSHIVVVRDDGDTLTIVARSALFPTTEGAGWEYETFAPAGGLPVTLEAGKTYYVGVEWIRNSSSAAVPYFALTADSDFTLASKRVVVTDDAWNGATIDTTDSTHVRVTTANNAMCLEVEYTSDAYTELVITDGAIGKYLIPVSPTSNYVVKLEQVVVEDTNALTCVQLDWNVAGAVSTLDTTELDMGDTVAGQNDLIDAGNTVNLPDIEGVGQEGYALDLIYGVRPATSKVDLYYKNKRLWLAPLSHAVSAAGVRGAKYTYTPGRALALSGTAEVGAIKVGVKPVCLIGDSQTYLTNTGLPYAVRWGALQDELTKPRIYIPCGTNGPRIEYIYNQWAAAIPGEGDAIEFCGLGALWFFGGPGLNDISQLGESSYTDSQRNVCRILTYFCNMLDDILAAGDTAAIAGLPPYSDAVNASKYEARAVRILNRGLLGLALMLQVPFYNPWPDMVQAGTEGDDVPTFSATYTGDGGIHYNAAGGTFIRAKMVTAIETGRIDLRDAWD